MFAGAWLADTSTWVGCWVCRGLGWGHGRTFCVSNQSSTSSSHPDHSLTSLWTHSDTLGHSWQRKFSHPKQIVVLVQTFPCHELWKVEGCSTKLLQMRKSWLRNMPGPCLGLCLQNSIPHLNNSLVRKTQNSLSNGWSVRVSRLDGCQILVAIIRRAEQRVSRMCPLLLSQSDDQSVTQYYK